MKRLLLMLLSLVTLSAIAQELPLIPRPSVVEVKGGSFLLKNGIALCYPKTKDGEIKTVAEHFAAGIETSTGVKLKLSAYRNRNKKNASGIFLLVDSTLAGEEYKLNVSDRNILVTASTPAGFFYAFQTVKQMLPNNVMAGVASNDIDKWSIPAVEISDMPRFAWRGFMLDEGRHFYGKDEIKKILDVMSAYKMNRFHWHLTEDQGWRIEIKKYPKLTEIGAWRDSKVCAWGDVKPDGIHYGGFYTREDINEVVEYAKERFIEIVPEVDIPGHSQAAVASYPEFLSCDPENKHEVWLWQGVSGDVINVANPHAVQFAKDIVDELTEMFPFGYIHLGGDECPTYKWERNAECQSLLKEIGSDNYRDLQIHFYKQLKEHIAQKPVEQQRKLIFWNEVLHGDTEPLGSDITIMAWIGADGAAKDAAGRGMNTILSPQIPYYINRRQSKLATEPRSQGYGDETVERVYSYMPMSNVPVELQSKYMGVQANFWTEWVIEPEVVQYLMLPRLAAVAEAGWTSEGRRNYDSFINRLQDEAEYYHLRGVDFGKHVFK